jgi:hypothetical protein
LILLWIKIKIYFKFFCNFSCQSRLCMCNLAAFCSKLAFYDKININFSTKHRN